MKKYIIKFNYGYGDEVQVVECDTLEEAQDIAYENWKEGAESQADYSAEEWTEEEAENYGL